MESFSVSNWLAQHKTAGQQVDVSRPKQIACWSKTSGGTQYLVGDTLGLLQYSAPQLPADLNEGFEGKYTRKSDTAASPVDPIIQAATAAGIDWSQINICTYRNNLNKLMMTPLDAKDWAIDCCYHNSTLYLDINKSGNEPEYANQDKFVYYGYKFEALCTGQEYVDATSEFAVVVQYRLGRHQLVMAAEVDAVTEQGEGPAGGRPYVEMKTYRIPAHAKAVEAVYREKHPRWWLQSFLAGVATMVLGGRDHKGQLLKVQEVPVRSLPGLSASAGQPWDPNVQLAFGDAVLTWMTNVAKQHAGQQLLVTYRHAHQEICCEIVEGELPARLSQLLSL